MNTKTTSATETQVEETAELIYDYIETAERNAYAGPLEEQVYHFFGGWNFADNIREYNDLCFYLLKALAQPEISTTVKGAIGNNYEPLLQMVDRLNNFCKDMAQDHCKAFIDVYAIRNHEVNDGKLEYIKSKYTELLEAMQRGEKLKQLIKIS